MKIVYYTSGLSGSGRIVTGIAIGNAFKRKRIACDYTILNSSPFAFLAADYKHIEIPAEDENILFKNNFHNSQVYKTILKLNPDVLLVDLLWAPLYYFIHTLSCKKVFLLHNVSERFFSIHINNKKVVFNKDDYNAVFAIEPVKVSFNTDKINPIIIRNQDEILSQENALLKLGISKNQPLCLFAFNGAPGEYEIIKKKYSYFENDYKMIYSTNYSDKGIFPIIDYFNAFNFIISGAGYNQFWEIIYFNKESVFEPMPRKFEDQFWRVNNCQEYYFEENGADQLADIIMNM